jgi:hypothetical protein
MSAPASDLSLPAAPLDLKKWSKAPAILIAAGALICLFGAFSNRTQFGYSYLLAFMFYLSICLGALLLTILHHLFDANWSVATRRLSEHMAWLLPVMAVLFIPIGVLARDIYPWMTMDPHTDHPLHAKQPLFTPGGFAFIALFVFAVWTWLSWNLRRHSIAQDKTGAAVHTHAMRFHSGYGIFAFAVTLTLAVIFWVKAISHQWYSTMYGVYFFAESVWIAVATLWVLASILSRTGHLRGIVNKNTMHCLGLLWFAFTVFYTYVHFSQYFLQWNANLPEETFFYVAREKGSWWQICMIIVFGHFLLPFLTLLRIDAKINPAVAIPLAIWAWLMHYCDMSFNIMPKLHPDGFKLHWMDVGCMAFIGGVLALVFIKYLNAHSPYPAKDPRLGESLGVHGPHPLTEGQPHL